MEESRIRKLTTDQQITPCLSYTEKNLLEEKQSLRDHGQEQRS